MLKKYIIRYTIKCITGLQIKAGSNSLDIGGVDTPVIKNPLNNEPYIPGSSLKGKMRSLLEWHQAPEELISKEGAVLQNTDYSVCKIFGVAPSANKTKNGEEITQTRLIVRDAFLSDESKKVFKEALGEGIYTEIKAENSINRLTGTANAPRFFERVPKGTKFDGEMILTIYYENEEELLKDVFVAMKLLQDNYLGGSGTRGAGQVKFSEIKVLERTEEYYMGKKDEEELDIKELWEVQ